jgi:hypothetical protein
MIGLENLPVILEQLGSPDSMTDDHWQQGLPMFILSYSAATLVLPRAP